MMPPDDTAVPAILPEPSAPGAAKFSEPLPADAAPDDVRHWFDLETIVELPAPVASFDDAADAAAQYRRASRSENTRRAYRAAVARFTRLVRGPRPHRAAGISRDGRRVSRRRGARRARGQHIAPAPRGDPLSAPARRLPAADRCGGGVDDLRRHQTRPPPAAGQEDGFGARSAARGDRDDPGDTARAARPGAAARRLRRGAAAERDREARRSNT